MSAAETLPSSQPSSFAPLLCLVRKLIDYGKQLVGTLRQSSPPADLHRVASGFGTYDISQILACIIRGLHRAAALEARLTHLETWPEPQPQPEPAAVASYRPRVAATPSAPRAPRAAATPAAPLTPEQIADQVRHQPIGEVFVDICRDLGILPWHPLWRDLFRAIILHGGTLGRLCMHIINLPRLAPAPPHPAPLADTG